MTYPFKNLVLAGGGIWGLSYAGIATVLEERGIYRQIERVAGVSVGSMFATFMCVGYEPQDIMRIVKSTDFHKFEDKPNIFRVFTKYGFFKGDFCLEWMRDMVSQSPLAEGNPDITFGELQEKGARELFVFATDLNTQTYKEFSARTTPDCRVVEAVRASMSLPIVFPAWRFTTGEGHLFCDGGMMNNYPINFFDEAPFIQKGRLDNHETLGFMFMAPKTNAPRQDDGLGFGNLEKYMKSLMEAIVIGVGESLNVPGIARRTVMTNAHATGISPMQFKIQPEEVELLIETGASSVTDYLNAYSPLQLVEVVPTS